MLELPSDNVIPLIQLERQITMGLDLACKMRVHGSFTGRSNGDRLLKVRLSAFGNPSNFSGETLQVFLLTLQVV